MSLRSICQNPYLRPASQAQLYMEPQKSTQPALPDNHLHPGGNIWGPKFPLFGLVVILLFLGLLLARAYYLGVPLGEVFRNSDPAPAAVDSTHHSQ
jgi:hypothetical protein